MPLFHNISNHSQRKNIVELSEENELLWKNRCTDCIIATNIKIVVKNKITIFPKNLDSRY